MPSTEGISSPLKVFSMSLASANERSQRCRSHLLKREFWWLCNIGGMELSIVVQHIHPTCAFLLQYLFEHLPTCRLASQLGICACFHGRIGGYATKEFLCFQPITGLAGQALSKCHLRASFKQYVTNMLLCNQHSLPSLLQLIFMFGIGCSTVVTRRIGTNHSVSNKR